MDRAMALRPAPRAGLFAVPDFRRLWLVGLVVFAVRWLEMLAMAIFAYQQTHSPLAVALLTMLRTLPMALFGAPLGAAAERIERHTALVLVVLSMALSSFTLALLAYAGRLAVWHLFAASFWSGIGWAADNPVRRTLIGEVVGTERMSAAMAIDVGANNASRMLGPTVGGVLLATVGIGGAFTVSLACYAVAIVAALRVRHRDGVRPRSGSVLAGMIEGLLAVRRNRRLVAILVITVIYNLFGWPFTSMVPVIGQDSLHLGPGGIGILASMDGVGAFCGAVLIAAFARPAYFTRLYVGGVLLYLVMLMVFAVMPLPLFAGAALLTTGLSNAGFSTMQATLVYLAAPPEMRSRIYGVLSVCIGVGPLGFLHLGLLAGVIGAPWATVATGIEGLLALVLTWPLWRPLIRSA
ncbi:MAG TPA: MFS transporter [Stellaceae bacterium]|nr:MFS transporter [Stellaceae bacterium]